MDMHTNVEYQIKLENDICLTQARIYERAALDGYKFPDFSEKYLSSHFCQNRMETQYSSFQREDAETCLEFIYPEIGFIRGTDMFAPDIAHWIGYTYFQLYCETGIHGAILKDKVPFSKLILNYAAHHTIDQIHSTDMLCNFFGLKKDKFHQQYSEYLDTI